MIEVPKGEGTTDNDIEVRTILPIDLDVTRPRNTSATDEQMALSIDLALRCREYLATVIPENSMAWLHSGNGRQIHLALDFIPESQGCPCARQGDPQQPRRSVQARPR